MNSENMTPEQLEAMHVRVGRRLQAEPTFGDVCGEAVEAAERGTPGERLALKHLAERMAPRDEEFAAAEYGQDVVDSSTEQLAEAISLLRREVNAATRDPGKHEVLTARLNRLVTRKATLAVASLMADQEDERQDGVREQLSDLEDLDD